MSDDSCSEGSCSFVVCSPDASEAQFCPEEDPSSEVDSVELEESSPPDEDSCWSPVSVDRVCSAIHA